ncbi:MAG: thioredoxin-like domain-containing protein [Gammaproteobacteria bacterium]|nr:thioredoxin-like domain-containing protein [Gammaproteobacteria bacterium]
MAWLALPQTQLALAANSEPLRGVNPAPAFPKGLDWINTEGEALTLEDLEGKVVLLDFWTYGCINCYHIIPDLKKLEEKYGDALVVIAVHSAKFDAEGDTRRIRQITHRYEREHPVVNDRGFAFWNRYGARAWPTLVLIDPAGNVVGKVAGEGHYELLDEAIGRMIDTFADAGELDRAPLGYEPFWKSEEGDIDSFLAFPGKILVDDERLYIADSNNHRIVVTDHSGKVIHLVGSGEAALRDGSFDEAAFQQPQGMTLDPQGRLIVADTLNSAIRLVDFEKGEVTTLAGNGEQEYLREDRYEASGTGLNSPWDVLWHDGQVYIAMAGQHQIWRLDPGHDRIEVFAGTRREALTDGRRLDAALNQPSGLATDAKRLYFADSEASAIRYAEFAEDGRLRTIVGTGLFDFGDVDGSGPKVRLQHPLGIDHVDGLLYIADTYNDKIKVIDPADRSARTLLGGDGTLFEPGGLDVHGGKVWIADTNNHAIKVYDLATGKLSRLEVVLP